MVNTNPNIFNIRLQHFSKKILFFRFIKTVEDDFEFQVFVLNEVLLKQIFLYFIALLLSVSITHFLRSHSSVNEKI
jgi:hypothetical protein